MHARTPAALPAHAPFRRLRRGFTLVEILIVVIILGILAAIVIPTFSGASEDARRNSTLSLTQTLRSQIGLYKLHHGDQWPTDDGTVTGTWDWNELVQTSTYNGRTYGPYLQQTPVNPFNNSSTVAAAPGATVGFVVDNTGFYASVPDVADPTTYVTAP